MIKAVLFDFGGVLAEEGFAQGIKAIARKNGIDPESFFKACEEIIYKSGYAYGRENETKYWELVREKTGIQGSDDELREEVLKRFVLRPDVFEYARHLRDKGYLVCILSDQTNWLEELDSRHRIFSRFDHVFNSYRMNASKREIETFKKVCGILGIRPDEALFFDDRQGHVDRARQAGLNAIVFETGGYRQEASGFLEKS